MQFDVGIHVHGQADIAMAGQGLGHFRRDSGAFEVGDEQVS